VEILHPLQPLLLQTALQLVHFLRQQICSCHPFWRAGADGQEVAAQGGRRGRQTRSRLRSSSSRCGPHRAPAAWLLLPLLLLSLPLLLLLLLLRQLHELLFANA
jgi:hypothetical protein